MQALVNRNTYTTDPGSRSNSVDIAWIERLLKSKGPIGFEAGDANLYRYVSNSPTNLTDPSGLVSGTLHHGYPLYLGGAANQPVIQLNSQAAHQAAHNYFSKRGFGFGDAGRANWRALSPWRQRAHIYRSLRAAGVPADVIRRSLPSLLRGANPGILTPRPRGFPGGRIPLGGPIVHAVVEVLVNPAVACAAESDRTFTNMQNDPNRRGRVEVREMEQVWNVPVWYNVFRHDQLVSQHFGEWADYGIMTAAEAASLRRIDRVIEVDPESTISYIPSGYRREIRVSHEVRFTELAPAPSR